MIYYSVLYHSYIVLQFRPMLEPPPARDNLASEVGRIRLETSSRFLGPKKPITGPILLALIGSIYIYIYNGIHIKVCTNYYIPCNIKGMYTTLSLWNKESVVPARDSLWRRSNRGGANRGNDANTYEFILAECTGLSPSHVRIFHLIVMFYETVVPDTGVLVPPKPCRSQPGSFLGPDLAPHRSIGSGVCNRSRPDARRAVLPSLHSLCLYLYSTCRSQWTACRCARRAPRCRTEQVRESTKYIYIYIYIYTQTNT